MQLFSRALAHLIGSTESEDTDADARISTDTRTQRTRPQSPPSAHTAYSALNEPLGMPGRKRGREMDAGEGGEPVTKRTRETRESEANRLLPNRTRTPADAQPFELKPLYQQSNELTYGGARKTQSRVSGSGFKPTNTLNVQRHTSEATQQRNQSNITQGGIRRLAPPRVSLDPSVVIKPSSTTDPWAKSFPHAHASLQTNLSKGNRGAMSIATSGDLSDDVIVVDGSPGPFGEPVRRSTQKTSQSLTGASTPVSSVARGVDEKLGHTRVNNRRKSKEDSARSSQPSTVASPVIKPTSRPANGSPAVVIPVSDSQDEGVQYLGQSSRSNGKGFTARTLRENGTDSRTSQPLSTTSQVPTTQRRLSETFRRDEPDLPKEATVRASQRMKATSNGTQNHDSRRTSTDSIDELSISETTVGSHIPNPRESASGRLAQRGTRRVQDVREDTRTSVDPSDSHPRAKRVDTNRVNNEGAEEEERIRVKCILCKACCLEDGEISLVWVPSDRAFNVELDGRLQKVPGKEQVIEIGRREIHSVSYAKHQGMVALHIKGSSNDVSNGHILMEFFTFRDFNHLLSSLRFAIDGKLSVSEIDRKKMAGTIHTTGDSIKDSHARAFKVAASRPLADEILLQAKKRKTGRQGASDEEKIKYDSASSSEIRSSKRTRMRSGDADAASSRPVQSKFFAYDKPERRRSSRQSKPVRPNSPEPPPPVRWSREIKIEPWQHSVVYPPEGATRRVTVDFQDIERLDEGEFLNDSLISFALRRIEESMSPEHKKKVHFFNSFFYEALTKKNGKKGFHYDAVSRWTKNKDLFTLPYVVVPINIDLHWFVAIICNLDRLPRKFTDIDLDDESAEIYDDLNQHATEQMPSSTPENPESNAMLMDRLSLSEMVDPAVTIIKSDDEGGREAVSSQPTAINSKKSKKKAAPPSRKYDPDSPAIITLDSFGSTRSGEIRNLKEYLKVEADSKRGMKVDPGSLQGVTAKGIPEQTNFCDCGVFLIGYIEKFAQDPRKFVTQVLQKELDRQNDFAHFDPSAKRAEIRELLLKLDEEQAAERKAKKAAKKAATTAQAQTSTAKPTAAPAAEAPADTAKVSGVNGEVQSSQTQAASDAAPAKLSSTKFVVEVAIPRQEDETDEIPMDVPRALRSSPFTGVSKTSDRIAEETTIAGMKVEVPDSQ